MATRVKVMFTDDDREARIPTTSIEETDATTPLTRQTSPNSANNTDSGNTGIQEQDRNQPSSGQENETINERDLRKWLKLFFYRPVKLENYICHIHIIYFAIAILQIIKVILLTSQAFLYGNDRAQFNSDVYRGHLAMRHLLLKGWDAGWETNSFPLASNHFAVYTTDSLEEGINYVVEQYYNVERNSFGNYKRLHNDSMQVVVKYFNFPDFQEAGAEKEIIIKEEPFTIKHGLSPPKKNETVYSYSIADELKYRNCSLILTRLLAATIKGTLYSVRADEDSKHALCLQIDGTVKFTDEDNTGQVQVDLKTHTKRQSCRGMNIWVKDLTLEGTTPLNRAVVAFCVISIIITVITWVFGGYVIWKTYSYMKGGRAGEAEQAKLPSSEYLQFIYHRLWDVPVFLSDCLTIDGTCKVFYKTDSELDVKLLDGYTIRLGLGCIFAWMSLLRYFRIHRKFYILFRILTRVIFDALAYLLCAAVLFVGFWICGYIVLGPYNTKFQAQSSAAETLFALINGDEIYATMAMLDDDQIDSEGIQVFASFYLVVYVCTFTIVAINLLIAFFTNALEEIKAEPKDRKLGPLENAIQDVIDNPDEIQLQSFHDLLNSDDQNSPEVKTLRGELSKIIKINAENKLESVKSNSLVNFIRDENDRNCRRPSFCLLRDKKDGRCGCPLFCLIRYENDQSYKRVFFCHIDFKVIWEHIKEKFCCADNNNTTEKWFWFT